MDRLDWKIPYMDNTHSSWPSLIRIVLFRSKDIHGAVRTIQIFTTKKYSLSDRPWKEKEGWNANRRLVLNSPDAIVPILGTSSAKVTEWVSRQSLKRTMECTLSAGLRYGRAFYQRFRFYQSTLVWFLLKHILGGWVQGGRFQSGLSIH